MLVSYPIWTVVINIGLIKCAIGLVCVLEVFPIFSCVYFERNAEDTIVNLAACGVWWGVSAVGVRNRSLYIALDAISFVIFVCW